MNNTTAFWKKAGLAAAIGASALTLTAMEAAPALAAATVSDPAPVAKPQRPVAESALARPRPGTAVNLILSKSTRTKLGDAYYHATHRKYPGKTRKDVLRPSPVYYGEIVGRTHAGDVYYALAKTGYRGVPSSARHQQVLRKVGDGAWVYVGVAGKGGCGHIPKKLLKAWGFSPKACI